MLPLIIVYLVLALLDDVTTYIGINYKGLVEANPVGLPWWSFVLKYGYPFVALLLPYKYRLVWLAIGIVITCITVINNVLLVVR